MTGCHCHHHLHLHLHHLDINLTSSIPSPLQITAAKARAASDAKGKFMASMSHEMRTPLNGVLGMLQLAMELELPPQAVK